MADQESKRKANLKPAIVALYKAADEVDYRYLDKRLFLPSGRSALQSAEQLARINMVTPTVR